MNTPWPLGCSHIRCWLFSAQEIESMRQSAHKKTLDSYQSLWPEVNLPSLEEILPVLQYYTARILYFTVEKGLRPSIQETACVYFNRFYLKKSILDYDPRILMYTCICMAMKVEEYSRSYSVAELFGSLQNINIQEIVALELPLSEALDFQLIVLHVQESLHALRDGCLEKLVNELKLNEDSVKEYTKIVYEIEESAEWDCLKLQETAELAFVYTPAQLSIALFSYHASLHLSSMFDVQRFLKYFALPSSSKAWPVVKQLIDTIVSRFHKHSSIEIEKSEFENNVLATMCKCTILYDLKKQLGSNKRSRPVSNGESSSKSPIKEINSDLGDDDPPEKIIKQ